MRSQTPSWVYWTLLGVHLVGVTMLCVVHAVR